MVSSNFVFFQAGFLRCHSFKFSYSHSYRFINTFSFSYSNLSKFFLVIGLFSLCCFSVLLVLAVMDPW